jgi:hypothetical protein
MIYTLYGIPTILNNEAEEFRLVCDDLVLAPLQWDLTYPVQKNVTELIYIY